MRSGVLLRCCGISLRFYNKFVFFIDKTSDLLLRGYNTRGIPNLERVFHRLGEFLDLQIQKLDLSLHRYRGDGNGLV